MGTNSALPNSCSANTVLSDSVHPSSFNNLLSHTPTPIRHMSIPSIYTYGDHFANITPQPGPRPTFAFAQYDRGVFGAQLAVTPFDQQLDERILIDRLFSGRVQGLSDRLSFASLVSYSPLPSFCTLFFFRAVWSLLSTYEPTSRQTCRSLLSNGKICTSTKRCISKQRSHATFS